MARMLARPLTFSTTISLLGALPPNSHYLHTQSHHFISLLTLFLSFHQSSHIVSIISSVFSYHSHHFISLFISSHHLSVFSHLLIISSVFSHHSISLLTQSYYFIHL